MQGLHRTADLHQCACVIERFTDARALFDAPIELFAPDHVERHALQRGRLAVTA